MGIQDVRKYLKIMGKWWWAVALLFGATVGALVIMAFFTEPQYEAKTTVQVTAPPPQEVPLYSQFGRRALFDEIEQTRSSFSVFLTEGDVVYRVLEALPEVNMTGIELREQMEIETPENSQLMHVLVRAPDPEEAALLANNMVEIGLQRYGELLSQSASNALTFIDHEIAIADSDLIGAEAELMQFQIDNRVGDLKSAINSQYNLIQDLRETSDLAQVEGDIAQVQALEQVILEREADLQDMIGLSAEYTDLADKVARARDTRSFLLDRQTEAKIRASQILVLDSIQVITPARPPDSPVLIIGPKIILLGAVVSLLAGVLLTFLLEYLEISGTFSGLRKHSERSDVVVLPDSVA